MSSREHSPRGIVRQYSKGCDQKCSKAKSVLRLPRSVEYCSFVNFRKEGNGIIQYFDDLNREVYVILGNWKKGNLCGKAILYNILEDCIESILYFNNGDFVDESPLSLEETDLYIIDKPDGYRWEVPIQNGMMAGRGTEYDEENKKVFAGWYYDNTRFGKGERFYSINEELQSRGFWHSGKEYGPMELFDLKGDYIGEVIMIHGEEVSQTCILHNPTQIEFSSFTESITIEGFEGPSVSIVDLSSCHHLKEIKIGDKCFLEARSFLLIDNPSIERIAIGTFAFYSHQGVDPYPLPYEDKRRILSNRKIASIRHCPKLRVLDIGNESFTDFISLELVQLPCLEVCHIGQPSPRSGEWGLNFYWCKNLNLQQLPALQSVRFGNYAFFYCYHLQIDCTIEWSV